eukprot:3905261-Rhodomonas_salina.1
MCVSMCGCEVECTTKALLSGYAPLCNDRYWHSVWCYLARFNPSSILVPPYAVGQYRASHSKRARRQIAPYTVSYSSMRIKSYVSTGQSLAGA